MALAPNDSVPCSAPPIHLWMGAGGKMLQINILERLSCLALHEVDAV